MKTWFWNQPENRLRAGWRVLAQVALMLGLIGAAYSVGLFGIGPLQLARIELSLLAIALLVIALAGRSAQAAAGMSLLAFALDVVALPLIVLAIRWRYGAVRLRRKLTVYEALHDGGVPASVIATRTVEAGNLK